MGEIRPLTETEIRILGTMVNSDRQPFEWFVVAMAYATLLEFQKKISEADARLSDACVQIEALKSEITELRELAYS